MTMPVSQITVGVTLQTHRCPGRKNTVCLEFGTDSGRIATKANLALMLALRYQKLLDSGRYANISDMAAAEKIER
jgi:hypothetical protein